MKLIKNNKEINLLVKRSRPFLYYLVQLAEHRQLPLELVLLPMIESGFQPDAVSPGNAAGLWQIRPITAINLGLTVSGNYDARYDIHASTEAALDYLEYLYEFFDDDWLLAIAAYNCGEGTVQKAIQSNKDAHKDTDYWSLNNLPSVTLDYVPRLLALSQIVANPKAHKVRLQAIADSPYLMAVEINQAINPFKLITYSAIDQQTALQFNPAFIAGLDVTPASPYKLLLPRDQALLLSHNLRRSSALKLVGGLQEKTTNNIKNRLPLQLAKHHSYYLNGSSSAKSNQQLNYIVTEGDTLESIARRYGVPIKFLVRWNSLRFNSNLKEGQKLVIQILNDTNQMEYKSSHKKSKSLNF